jgi:hypothetical protein
MSNNVNGSSWSVGGFGLGVIHSHNTEIEICETTNSRDYKIISDWINN